MCESVNIKYIKIKNKNYKIQFIYVYSDTYK